jgi:flagellar protein FlaF
MYPSSQARSAYATAPVRTARDAEYAIFATVTRALSTADETDYPGLARAVNDNLRLWGALAEDLMSEGNALPLQLRGNLISLAGFVRKHTMAVLGGRAGVAPLVDINTMIMKGLRGDVEAAA